MARIEILQPTQGAYLSYFSGGTFVTDNGGDVWLIGVNCAIRLDTGTTISWENGDKSGNYYVALAKGAEIRVTV